MSNNEHRTDKKFRTSIGLLIQDLQFRLYLGAAEGAHENGANLFCFVGDSAKSTDPALKQSNIVYDLIDPARLDALALWGGSGAAVGLNLDQTEMTRFLKNYAPLPVVNYERKIEGVPVILTDVYQGVREAVRHLIEIHHRRRIALIWGPAGHFETEERVRAYRDTLAEYNLPVDPKLISEPVLWGIDGGIQAINTFLNDGAGNHGLGLIAGVDFDAILTTDCAQAIGALGELHHRDIRVPDDLVVIGFDERDDSRLTSPPLTTIKKPFAEVGKRLIELALDAAAGNTIPENTHVPTQLIIRQSCGCIDPSILQASLDKTQVSQEKYDIIINTRRANFLAEIASGMQAAVPASDQAQIQQMVDGFIKDLAGDSTGSFARSLDDFLHQEIADITTEVHPEQPVDRNRGYHRSVYDRQAFDGSTWQNMISAMQRCMLPHLDGKKRSQADTLWNQARISIGSAAQRLQALQAFLSDQKVQILREIEANLSSAFNLEALTNALAAGLPQLGIQSCYLSLYEHPQPYEFLQPAPKWSRLVLAYTENGRIALVKDGIRFPSRQLVPDGLLPNDRQAGYLVIPLYFGEEQQGFVLLEIGPQEAIIYNALKNQISSTLHGATLVKHIEERAIRLQAAAEVSRAASSLLDVDELTQQAVDLIHNRFGLYYVGLFLIDQSGDWTGEAGRRAVLRAGTGEAGQKMLSQGHKLEINGESMIGWCAANNSARITLDTDSESSETFLRYKNPLLPETRSEMALPLTSRGQVLGALSIQSSQRSAFTDEDITILQSMADQLANAIANANLYAQTQNALREMETIYRRYLVRGWSEYAQTRSASGYRQNEKGVTPLGDELLPEVEHALLDPHLTTINTAEEAQQTLVVPIKLRDNPIGAIGLRTNEGQRQWSEDDIALVETLSEQFALAAENIRLLEETQRRAEREHMVSEITTRLRASNDPQTILQTAAGELRRALNAKNARVLIESMEQLAARRVIGKKVVDERGDK